MKKQKSISPAVKVLKILAVLSGSQQGCHRTQEQHNLLDSVVTVVRGSKVEWARIPDVGSFVVVVPILQGCLATTPRPKPSD